MRSNYIVCWCCCLMAMLFPASLVADTLVGKVLDENDAPVSFASIYIENNPQKGTVTDVAGIFTLEEVSVDETVVVSFIGYKTMQLNFKKIPTDTLTLRMQEQPILLSETEVGKAKKHVSKRRQKKNLLNEVYEQMQYDFPLDNHFYKVISDYAIYHNNTIAAFEELSGNVIEMPGKGKKGRDSVQLLPQWVKRYRHPDTHQRLSKIDDKLRKQKNAERIQLVDSSIFVHRVLWGGDIRTMFEELKGKVSKWEGVEQDSCMLLTFHDRVNFLGIVKYDLVLNLVLDSYSYRVRKQSQSLVVEADIPFGYKLNADQLAILNTVNLSSEDIEKFRLKKVHVDVKRNILYEEKDNKVYVDEKNVITKVKMEDNKGKKLDFHQTALMHVLSASLSEVKPYTQQQLQQSYEFMLQTTR